VCIAGAYSPTVILPKTDFNIRAMSNTKEPEIQQFWEDNKIYQEMASSAAGEAYTLHDGPPYANGDLHCGHALNKILKDFIVRRKLLEGRKARFVPGWDTHGLPIELKVCPTCRNKHG
jgi:isoleucyl-tRNA synthetase